MQHGAYVACAKIPKPLKRLAGAPGFEPGNGGIKIRCLTTWLRPKSLRELKAAHGIATRSGTINAFPSGMAVRANPGPPCPPRLTAGSPGLDWLRLGELAAVNH